MQRPLRDYSTLELERLLADIRTAIERAEIAESRSTAGETLPDAQTAVPQEHAGETRAPAPEEGEGLTEARRDAPPAPARRRKAATQEAPAEPLPAPEPPAPEPPVSEHPASEPPVSAPPRIRYMHPSNRNLTWTGDGERPEWVDVYLTLGGSWTALENTAEKLRRRPG